ncbi:MAG: DNRLRE domain-containing protein [Pyrinomonadaceae bacterium]|nr:DNRLRE domain-containing protein [Phycisphaerales bacterium]
MCTTRIVLCLAGLLLCAAGTARADTVTLQAAKDNTLYQDDLGLLSNGAGAYFFAGVNGNGEIRRGLIAFDLSGIPVGAVISSASLTARMSRTTGDVEAVSLHRMLENWGEGASNAAANEGRGTVGQPGDATWLFAYLPGTLWAGGTSEPATGGNFETTASATTPVDQIGFYSWTGPGLNADVQRFVSSPGENFGWLVHGFENGVSTAKRFDSRQNNNAANRPTLTVTYSIPAPVCPCDLDRDGKVTSADMFLFLPAFFGEEPIADFDGSGLITSADFFEFLTCFFGLPGGCS